MNIKKITGKTAELAIQWSWRGLRAVRKLFPHSHYALLALMFGVGLELLYFLQRWVIVVAILVISMVIIGVVLVRLEEKQGFKLIHTILPILATLSLSGFAFFLPTSNILHLYIAGAAFILFFLLKHGARQAYPLWNWVISLIIYFLSVATIFGLRYHVYIPVMAVLAAVAAVTGLMALQALRRVADSVADVILPGLALSFAITEIAWALQFLPFHAVVQASLVTTLYYVIFSLVSISYSRRTTKKDFVEYVGLGVVAITIITLSARWV